MFASVALFGIDIYQRRISPRKGWRCAHSVLHGGTGCSGYAKHAIRDHGLWHAIPLIRTRFAECKDAYITLRSEREGHQSKRKTGRRSKTERCFDGACTGFEGCAFLPSLCTPARAAGKSKVCDINPCDGDLGCGPCDVDICSCG
ncbi:MAG: membrane protein insertion efficiency factor YidD [Pseudomonadota bacterium]